MVAERPDSWGGGVNWFELSSFHPAVSAALLKILASHHPIRI